VRKSLEVKGYNLPQAEGVLLRAFDDRSRINPKEHNLAQVESVLLRAFDNREPCYPEYGLCVRSVRAAFFFYVKAESVWRI